LAGGDGDGGAPGRPPFPGLFEGPRNVIGQPMPTIVARAQNSCSEVESQACTLQASVLTGKYNREISATI
jgi:hypothetical protein